VAFLRPERQLHGAFCNSFAQAATKSQSKYRAFCDENIARRFNLQLRPYQPLFFNRGTSQ